jgi:formylglycine-generating enzyme required for sulfatase activity
VPLACLDEGQVLGFLGGTLPADARAEVEAHIAGCSKCDDLVTWAAADLAASGRSEPGPAAPRPHVAPGSQIGRYQVLGAIGRGGMGEVFAAYHPDLDRRIALKLVTPAGGTDEPALRLRLLREARAIARMSHPNVVAVHDAGTFEGSVYIAMEFVDGETVADWLRTPRPWRQTLQIFIAAGRGLGAAHAAGVVHRDFKPQNVMIGKGATVRVMDFGLARFARDGGGETMGDSAPAELGTGAATVTKAGVIVGTPAYMAPEQFVGERGDEQSDQFSFCVALYEALYGERPFSGDDPLDLSVNVTEGRVRPLPKDRGVPAWVRRAVMVGLKRDPASRWPSMAALIASLERPPGARLGRRLLGWGAVAAAAGLLFGARQVVTGRRAEAEQRVGRQIDRGRSAAAAARAKEAAARDLRRRAFDAFDAPQKDEGESLWRRTRALVPEVEASFEEAARAYEAAATLAPDRPEIRASLADVRDQHFRFGEDFRLVNRIEVLGERLAAADFDGSRRRALAAPGWLVLRAAPAPSEVVLERYERDPITGRRNPTSLGPLDISRPRTELPPGSYRVRLAGAALAEALYPFEITRGRETVVDVTMLGAAAVPRGFVYVPAGESWYGDADETLRTSFLRTVPLHRRATGPFLIARRETTYAEWIAFLEALPRVARDRYLPDVSGAGRGWLRLRPAGAGWRLAFQPTTEPYAAASGEAIRYLGRKRRAVQNWLDFPVAGVDAADAEAYIGWLRSTGTVPGARLCTDVEWERAARGADDRLFPHGDELAPDDANFGPSHGMDDAAYGPDEVGTHPISRSPFGVDDLAGNVLEIVVSSEEPDRLVVRGGAYYFDSMTCRSTNRETIPKGFRDATAGIRVCASLPAGTAVMTQSGH